MIHKNMKILIMTMALAYKIFLSLSSPLLHHTHSNRIHPPLNCICCNIHTDYSRHPKPLFQTAASGHLSLLVQHLERKRHSCACDSRKSLKIFCYGLPSGPSLGSVIMLASINFSTVCPCMVLTIRHYQT